MTKAHEAEAFHTLNKNYGGLVSFVIEKLQQVGLELVKFIFSNF